MEGWNRKVRTLYTWSHLYLGFKVAQVRSRMLPEQQREQYWKERHTKFARSIWSGIADLRGWWVKVGQFLSTRADLLPNEYVAELEKLQDMMPTSSFAIIKDIVERELGKPLFEVFSEFNETALASASIAQVHKARLRNGDEVVVKVQHPNVDRMLSQDMKLLGQLSWAFGLLEKGLNFTSVLEEWQKQASLELDFRYEMQSQVRVHAAMERAGINVIIPKCYPEYTTQRVMVMEFINGFKVTDKQKLDEHKVNVDQLCTEITKSFAYQIHMDGMFNGDPHPGNIMVQINDQGEAKPVLIDWGLVKEFTDRERLAFARCIVSVANIDVMGLMEAFQAMGFRFRRKNLALRKKRKRGRIVEVEETSAIPVDPEVYMDAIGVLFSNKGSDKQSKQVLREKDKQKMWTVAKTKGKADVAALQEKNPLDDWPKDIIFFLRVASLLHGLTVQLRAKVPFFQILLARAEEAIVRSGSVPGQYVHMVLQSLSEEYYPKSLRLYGSPFHDPVTPSCPRSLLEWRIHKHLLVALARGDLLGCTVSVWHKRSLVVDVAIGRMGPYDARPVQSRTLFTAFSIVNVWLTTVLLFLVSSGKLKLSDCVSEWWDQFIRHGKRDITVEQILSHQSGVHSFFPSNLSLSQITNYRYMIKLVEDCVPICAPGMCNHYPLYCSSWIFHELIAKVTKLRPQKLFRSVCLRDWKLNRLAKHIYYPIPVRFVNAFKQLEVEENKADLLIKSMTQPQNASHKLIDFKVDTGTVKDPSSAPTASQRPTPEKSQSSQSVSRNTDTDEEDHSQPSLRLEDSDDGDTPQGSSDEDRDEFADETSPAVDLRFSTPQPRARSRSLSTRLNLTNPVPKRKPAKSAKFEISLSDDEIHRDMRTIAVLDQVSTDAIQSSLRRKDLYRDAMESWNSFGIESSAHLQDRFREKMMASQAEIENSMSRRSTMIADRTPPGPLDIRKSRSRFRVLKTMLDSQMDEPIKKHRDAAMDLMSRLAQCRRDLGIARVADASSMALSNLPDIVESQITEEEKEELLRDQEEEEWIAALKAKRNEVKPLQEWDAVELDLSILSKYSGRVASMREYTRQREIENSKIAELIEKQSKKVEFLSAIELMRRRPHLMDPLLFDSKEVASLDIPCANARVTARAMATLVHAVSRGHIIRLSLLAQACIPRTVDNSLEAYIGTGGLPPIFGLGYQLLPYRALDPTVHAASIGMALSNSPDRAFDHPNADPLPPKPLPPMPTMTYSKLCEPNASVSIIDHRSAPKAPKKQRPTLQALHAAQHKRSSIAFKDPVDDRVVNKPRKGYAFGTSDMNGNLVFSFPEEELSLCVLVNDTISGSALAQEVLKICMDAFGIDIDYIHQQHQ
eukprot:Gregarina_sp_Poly_1__886@NODE_1211_length_4771_cov_58_034226_g62_i1_p1_GENE_NODE_1211_length_4771_cov_58_034226_g62_i1NODE_1211_length_4771_cov_58_034226_g62_i1_p1_ORF_typecomplete_len1356_score213_32ABC1/PF03109_16/4_2e31Betalactamase/PF00144_24/1_3e25Betalactamase/PF00144_24/21WaaY/PF06176_11/3_4e03WaaY/PF06176_11/4_3e16RIO1/PF01163_22/1_8e03RIO1/PF01163_22/4e11Kdo/PF06293_14/6e08APH/PF01636_23/0_00026APH/PF01636_23/6_9e03YrbLPhoP_reg/PF10707_9/0_00068Pkinase_fungal/PF17667_1/0_042EcKinase/PF0